jgi:hypothetical protein
MPVDFSDLVGTLNQSKVIPKSDSAFQTLRNLIAKLQELTAGLGGGTDISAIQQALADARVVRFIEPNTASTPQTRILADDVSLTKAVEYKDYQGNAGANNITLSGTVDGVANPVINTNFGVFRVYKSTKDGLFHEW